jgi:hypothetical protein
MVADFIFSPNLPLCAASFAATALLTRYAWPVCERLGLIDLPDARKQHARATPLLGGPALIGIILPLALLATWLSPVSSNISLLHLAVTTAAVALVGILDDRRPLSARVRVGLAFVLFGGLALYNKAFLVRRLVFPIFGVQFGLYSEGVALLFTVVCCVGLVNAINMADGKNGLVLGLCIGWLMLIMARSTVGDIPFMAVMLAGLISLLVINLRGRLFLGDGRSLWAGRGDQPADDPIVQLAPRRPFDRAQCGDCGAAVPRPRTRQFPADVRAAGARPIADGGRPRSSPPPLAEPFRLAERAVSLSPAGARACNPGRSSPAVSRPAPDKDRP